jgi:hypothetical protein
MCTGCDGDGDLVLGSAAKHDREMRCRTRRLKEVRKGAGCARFRWKPRRWPSVAASSGGEICVVGGVFEQGKIGEREGSAGLLTRASGGR